MMSWIETVKNAQQQLPSRTLVELVGRSRLLVEHHRGIVGYSPEQILIGTDYGILRIEGENLRLCCMSREQVFLSGVIRELVPETRGQ